MALISCPECQGEISSEANTCPNCGFDLHRKKKIKLRKIVVTITGIVLVVVLSVVIYDACTISADEASENLRKSKEEVERLQDELEDLQYKKRVTEWLIDQYED